MFTESRASTMRGLVRFVKAKIEDVGSMLSNQNYDSNGLSARENVQSISFSLFTPLFGNLTNPRIVDTRLSVNAYKQTKGFEMSLTSSENDVWKGKEFVDLCCYYQVDGNKIPVFPYVVAVVGRRSIADASGSNPPGCEEKIKAAFKAELEAVAEKWFETSKGYAPIVLLTGMSDGSDQIAAEAALGVDERFNVKVVAVLPMEKDVFRLTVENQKRFDNLMGRVHYSFVLPVDPLTIKEGRESDLARVDDPETEITRRRQYRRLGLFLAVHSHVLFALWDGIDDQKIGGTTNAIRFKLQGSFDEKRDDFLTYSSVGPVVQLQTPCDDEREKMVDSASKSDEIPVFFWTRKNLWEPEKAGRLFPDRSIMTEERRLKGRAVEESGIKNVLEKTGRLNVDAVSCYDATKSEFEKMEFELLGRRNDLKNAIDDETRVLVDHYLVADGLAVLFQSRSRKIGKWLGVGDKKKSKVNGYPFWVALLSFVGVMLQFSAVLHQQYRGDIGNLNWIDYIDYAVMVFYLIIFVCVLIIVRKASSDEYHYRYFRSRAVAEALRVQIFWRFAGMNDCVSGYYRSHQIDDTEWLRTTINGLDAFLSAPNSNVFGNEFGERLVEVRDVWINGQLKYFESSMRELRKSDSTRWWEKWEWSTILWCVLVGFFPFLRRMSDFNYSVHDFKTFCSILFGTGYLMVALITSFAGYSATKKQLLGQKPLADRYERMILPYDRAVMWTTRIGLPTDKTCEYWRRIFRQLGAEAVAENADWLLTVGERDLALPQ